MVLVQTFGLAIVMTQILEKTFGASERLMRFNVSKHPVMEFSGVMIPTNEAVVFVIALLSTLALLLLLNFTDFGRRSEEHTSELQSLMRISYAVFCLKKKKNKHAIN